MGRVQHAGAGPRDGALGNDFKGDWRQLRLYRMKEENQRSTFLELDGLEYGIGELAAKQETAFLF